MTGAPYRWTVAVALTLCALARPARAAMDLLVTSQNNGRVLHYDGATGAYEGVFIANGAGGLSGATALALGTDGKVYVAGKGGVTRFELSTGVSETFVSGLAEAPADLVFGADGNLYGTLGPLNQVFKADGATGVVTDFFGSGTPLSYAAGLTFGPDGNLYVSSFSTNQVLRFNPTTGAFIDVFATVPIGGTGGNVGGAVFGPDGNLYVSLPNYGNDIYRFDGASGAALGPFAGAPKPVLPRLLAFGPDGNLYATALGTNEVLRYDGASGALIDHFARSAGLDGAYDVLFVPEFTTPNEPPVVGTTSGPVQGVREQGVVKYQGIPYAEAPASTLRWKRPVRRATSPTTIDATAFGPSCPQLAGATIVGNEDCLKITLWRPELPSGPGLPVLVYIHGGAVVGSYSWGVTDGTDFARNQGVIVAEMQYRIGALGFFGLPELAAEDPNGSTGNYGFLDQLEALRWVRDNISAFGGDPNQVTIAGESWGGTSVCALMASSLSDGLFRAGIMQSGRCDNAHPLTLPATSLTRSDPFLGAPIYDRSSAVAASVGCPAGPGQLACLRNAPLLNLFIALAVQPRGPTGEQIYPAIDGYVLPEQPVGLLRKGTANHRALMIGSVANESSSATRGLESTVTTAALYDSLVRKTVGNTRADALLPLYPAAGYPSLAEAYRALAEDAIVVCPSLDAADAAAAGGSPAWLYHLSFPPTYLPTSSYADLRTFHELDLYYVFGSYAQLAADYGIAIDADDVALSDSMQNAWGSFVRTGAPATAPAWPVYAPTTPGDLASVSALDFDAPNTTTLGTLFRSGRCAALLPVANVLDSDRDVATFDEDDCPTTVNTNQADAESDGVGDACDNCVNVANPRVAPDFLSANPWATLTGGQRDDDHDGYGNRCDAKFPGVSGSLVNASDLVQFRASNGRSRTGDTCGTNGTRACAIFDLDESGGLIGAGDLARFRQLQGKIIGPRCAGCPLACTAGASGSCN